MGLVTSTYRMRWAQLGGAGQRAEVVCVSVVFIVP